jgi:hypothetical protein
MPYRKGTVLKPDSVSNSTIRQRTRLLYPIVEGETCERCGESPAVERTYVDNDPTNNLQGNVLKVCRWCRTTSDKATQKSIDGKGRHRARVLYPIAEGELCERCNAKYAADHHHVDADPTNNKRDNVQKLCKSCHMHVDGRIAKLQQAGTQATTNPNKQCHNCGKESVPLRRNLCGACYAWWIRLGTQRPV